MVPRAMPADAAVRDPAAARAVEAGEDLTIDRRMTLSTAG